MSPPGTPGGYSPPFCDISGQWLPGVSRWAASYGLEYSLPPALRWHGPVSAYAGFDGSYRSTFSSNPSRSIYTDVPGYAIANFLAGARAQRWEIFGWVHNAFNKDYFQFLATQSGNTGMIVGQPGDPRTYGVTARLTLK
jgi:iron complex outermembrane receptor protein